MITAYFFAALFVANCTSNDFFEIEDVENGLIYPTMEKIARSKEYVAYQKQVYFSMDEINNLDTTKTLLIGNVDGKPIYGNGATFSIQNVLEARQQLIDVYPEYETAADYEKNEILNIAILYNKSLLRMAKRYTSYNQFSTKALCIDKYAYKYVHSGERGTYECLSTDDGGEWLVLNKYHWYARSWWYDAVCMAISSTEASGLERGGYAFQDQSGLLIIDPNATNTEHYAEMSFVWWDLSKGNEYQPVGDFHVHPSYNNVTPSDSDIVTWSKMPWNQHYIIDLGGHVERF